MSAPIQHPVTGALMDLLPGLPALRDQSTELVAAFQSVTLQLQLAWQGGATTVTLSAEVAAQLTLLPPPLLARAGTTEALGAALVSDGTRLWLGRAYAMELATAQALAERMQRPWAPQGLGADLDRAFEQLAGMPWPLRAHLHCMTGGPGSGKSTRIAPLLAGLAVAARPGIVRLLAPTGKAAMRMVDVLSRESVRVTAHMRPWMHADASARLAANFAAPATTVHSALVVPQRALYWHHTSAVIVDEASMLDAEILAQLVAVIPAEVPLILIGDSAQLPAVGVGSVLRDCEQVLSLYADGTRLTQLGSPARFDPVGPIAALAQSIVSHGVLCGSPCALRSYVPSAHSVERVQIREWTDDAALYERLTDWLHSHADLWRQYWQGAVDMRLSILARTRVLAAVREGGASVRRLGQTMRRWFQLQGLGAYGEHAIYAGLPVLVTRNTYELGLANGDMGVVFERQGTFWVYFSQTLQVRLDRLPAYESAWVSTIHKAQGSEFQHVCVVLPQQDPHGLLSRELLYTAVTRVRSAGLPDASLTLLAPAGGLCRAAGQSAARQTGLVSLWQSSVQ